MNVSLKIVITLVDERHCERMKISPEINARKTLLL